MKILSFFLFLTFLTGPAFPNDKGNGLDPEQRHNLALELILEHGLEVQEKTYVTLSAKHTSGEGFAPFARYPNKSGEKLKPHTEMSSNEIHPSMKPFTILVSELIKLEQFELLQSVTVEDLGFFTAFSSNNADAEELVLITSFWLMLKAKVVQESGENAWRNFSTTIDPARLGYAIP